MSSSSNWPTPRREALRALGALAALSLAAEQAPALDGHEGLPPLRAWGRGEFRRFSLLVYEAALWAGDDPTRPPLALALTYRRAIRGQALAEASVQEMRRLLPDDPRLPRWGEQLTALFPDVKPGDRITGLQLPSGARFTWNGRPLGAVDDPAFARAFFGIWLDARTSAPELRAALLRGPGG